jgi:hypothetical protein
LLYLYLQFTPLLDDVDCSFSLLVDKLNRHAVTTVPRCKLRRAKQKNVSRNIFYFRCTEIVLVNTEILQKP